MTFDKSRVYTALNADELKAGDKVFVADNIADMKKRVTSDKYTEYIDCLDHISSEDDQYRFVTVDGACALAYLVERAEDL